LFAKIRVNECNGDLSTTMRIAKSRGFASARTGSRDVRFQNVWSWRRKRRRDGFPDGFRVQRIGVTSAMAISDLPPSEIARYLHEHPETARDLLRECEDKRFTPSTIISDEPDGFRVGWFTRDAKYECVQKFTDLPDAATDYLLFSLGKGRWMPTSEESEKPE
jgi:hypothetical protein